MKAIRSLIVIFSMVLAVPFSSYAAKGSKAASAIGDAVFGLNYDRLSKTVDWLVSNGKIGDYGLKSVAKLPEHFLVRTFSGKKLMVLIGKSRPGQGDETFIEVGEYLAKIDNNLQPFQDLLEGPIRTLDDAEDQLTRMASKYGLSVTRGQQVSVYRTGVAEGVMGNVSANTRFQISGTPSVADMKRFMNEFHQLMDTLDGLAAM